MDPQTPSDEPSLIPVTLLSGYLGSGKTTLVNHVLRNAEGLRIAVMVNDFGDLPIDASLIVAEDEDIIQLSGGCVCCSYGNDLVRALTRLQALPEKPEHVLIECSGVALPKPVKMSLSLIQGLTYDGTVGLIDGSQVLTQLEDRYIGDTVERQIGQADILFVSKSDLLDKDAIQAVANRLASITSTASVNIENGCGPLEAILSLGNSMDFDLLLNSKDEKTEVEVTHANFTSAVVRASVGLNLDSLKEQLMLPSSGILRAKGYVYADDGFRYLLQMVGSSCQFIKTDNNPISSPSGNGLGNDSAFVIIGVTGKLTVPSIG